MTRRIWWQRLKGQALDLLFPPRCVSCGQEGALICSTCIASFIPIRPPLCSHCGLPHPEGGRCPVCAEKLGPLDGLRSLFTFEGVMRQAIHSFKYQNLKGLAPTLGQLLFNYWKANPLPAQVVVPVPLHQHRLRYRGYNQSALLAQELGQLTSLPVVDKALLRTTNTPPQAQATTAAQRRSNIKEAFLCQKGLEGKAVLLIDDVCTTGATLEACALALKEAGATSVWGLTLAREL
ncbi:MAG: ComF family protein [Chloroflexi bacterium]|nr:ComF family protein [Chloroflexota bacterium]